MTINLGNITLVSGNITLGEMTLRRLDQTKSNKIPGELSYENITSEKRF